MREKETIETRKNEMTGKDGSLVRRILSLTSANGILYWRPKFTHLHANNLCRFVLFAKSYFIFMFSLFGKLWVFLLLDFFLKYLQAHQHISISQTIMSDSTFKRIHYYTHQLQKFTNSEIVSIIDHSLRGGWYIL